MITKFQRLTPPSVEGPCNHLPDRTPGDVWDCLEYVVKSRRLLDAVRLLDKRGKQSNHLYLHRGTNHLILDAQYILYTQKT